MSNMKTSLKLAGIFKNVLAIIKNNCTLKKS